MSSGRRACALAAAVLATAVPLASAQPAKSCKPTTKIVHGKRVKSVCPRRRPRVPPVKPTADVAVTVQAPSTVSLGADLTYTIVVSNRGPAAATGVSLRDDLPASFSFVGATGATCSTAAPLVCALPRLPATVTLVVRPTAAGPVTNSVSVSATTADPNPGNNRADATSTVALRFVLVGAYEAQLAAATTLSDAEAALRAFGTNYGLAVDVVAPAPASYYATFSRLDASDLGALKAYGAMLVDEWAKYPPAFVAASGLRTIKLVKGLAVAGVAKTAAPTPFDAAMIYDVTAGTDDYARSVLHHEFDHYFTFQKFGTYAPADQAWLALNPPGFHYGGGGTSCYVAPSSCPSGPHVVAGFVSGYATSAIEEDKAETFAYLMDDAEYHQVQTWVKTDAVLAAKVSAYEEFLCGLSAAMCGSYLAEINP